MVVQKLHDKEFAKTDCLACGNCCKTTSPIFTEKDIEWIKFVKRLKDTGMPLEVITDYADLRSKGDTTSALRMKLLEKHALLLKEKIDLEKSHLKKLEQKIEHYRDVIESDVVEGDVVA